MDLAYETTGDPGQGLPVVLLPAFPMDRAMWRPVARALAEVEVPGVLVDLPGLGASPVPGGEPALAISGDGVVAVMDRLGVRRAVVAGVSMGGYVALDLARRHAGRLAGLALVDTKAEADGSDARAQRERVAVEVLGPAGTRALAPMVDNLLGASTRSGRPEIVDLVTRTVVRADAPGVAWSQRAMASRPDSTAMLGDVGVPAAVVVGEEDVLTPVSVAHRLAGALPDAVLTVIPSAGHLTPLEAPRAVAAALLALLVRIRAMA